MCVSSSGRPPTPGSPVPSVAGPSATISSIADTPGFAHAASLLGRRRAVRSSGGRGRRRGRSSACRAARRPRRSRCPAAARRRRPGRPSARPRSLCKPVARKRRAVGSITVAISVFASTHVPSVTCSDSTTPASVAVRRDLADRVPPLHLVLRCIVRTVRVRLDRLRQRLGRDARAARAAVSTSSAKSCFASFSAACFTPISASRRGIDVRRVASSASSSARRTSAPASVSTRFSSMASADFLGLGLRLLGDREFRRRPSRCRLALVQLLPELVPLGRVHLKMASPFFTSSYWLTRTFTRPAGSRGTPGGPTAAARTGPARGSWTRPAAARPWRT